MKEQIVKALKKEAKKHHDHSEGKEGCPNKECSLHDPVKYAAFHKAIKEHKEDGFIKVRFALAPGAGAASESLWAIPIDSYSAIIKNIPFLVDDVGLDDIVETEGDGFVRKFVRLSQKMTDTKMFKYNPSGPLPALKARFNKIWEVFKKQGIRIEGASAGYAAMCIPIDMDESKIQNAINDLRKKKIEIVVED
jgi:Domain of unknown function (DUF4265)